MEIQNDQRHYELAYHLTPEIEEGAVKAKADELASLLSQSGALLLNASEPKHKHLSYPLHHKKYSYFGVFDFNAAPEIIEKLNAQLKLQSGLLRFLLIQQSPADQTRRVLGTERSRPRMKTHEPVVNKEAPVAPIKPEQMEKELEEVLGKI